jgi:hypothetical protein
VREPRSRPLDRLRIAKVLQLGLECLDGRPAHPLFRWEHAVQRGVCEAPCPTLVGIGQLAVVAVLCVAGPVVDFGDLYVLTIVQRLDQLLARELAQHAVDLTGMDPVM